MPGPTCQNRQARPDEKGGSEFRPANLLTHLRKIAAQDCAVRCSIRAGNTSRTARAGPGAAIGIEFILIAATSVSRAAQDPYQLDGRVCQENGHPFRVPAPIIHLTSAADPYYAEALADLSGHFRIKAVPAGSYTLTDLPPAWTRNCPRNHFDRLCLWDLLRSCSPAYSAGSVTPNAVRISFCRAFGLGNRVTVVVSQKPVSGQVAH